MGNDRILRRREGLASALRVELAAISLARACSCTRRDRPLLCCRFEEAGRASRVNAAAGGCRGWEIRNHKC